MKRYGFQELGYEKMIAGLTGKPLEIEVFMGPVYFQGLKHHVRDKVQVRSRGMYKPMSRQPPKGRKVRGGLRFGEMERDVVITHGLSAFLRERLKNCSDAYVTCICATCGMFAVQNSSTREYECPYCKGRKDTPSFGMVSIPYVYKLLIHLLAAAGINLRPVAIKPDEYANMVFSGRTGDNVSAKLDEQDLQLDEGNLEKITRYEIEEDAEKSQESILEDVYTE